MIGCISIFPFINLLSGFNVKVVSKALYFVPDFVTEFALCESETIYAGFYTLVYIFSLLYTVCLQSFRTDFFHRILPVLSNGHCWD